MDWRAYSLRESIHPSSQVKFATMEIEQIRSRWNDVLDTLESYNRVAWIAYFDARLTSFEDGLLTLDFSDSRKFATAHEYSETRPNLKAALISSIHEVLGLTVEIREQ
jgi:hypothetical protein